MPESTAEPSATQVWLRPLGHAWKVRVDNPQDADRIRDVLGGLGWRCTPASPAFDVPGMVLFRAVTNSGSPDRPLDAAMRQVSGVSLMNEPA